MQTSWSAGTLKDVDVVAYVVAKKKTSEHGLIPLEKLYQPKASKSKGVKTIFSILAYLGIGPNGPTPVHVMAVGTSK